MQACKAVRKWITENVKKPFEEWIEKAEESCTKAKKWVEKEIREPVEKRRKKVEKKCKKRKCKWACLCCNKWFCWLETLLEIIVEWIIRIVGEWLVELICKIVVKLIKVIVQAVVAVLKFVIVGFTCLFTHPRGALDALIDLWYDVVDIATELADLFKDLINALADFLDITKEFLLDLGNKFGWIGRVIGGILAGLLDVLRRIVEGLGRVARGLLDFFFALFHLDFCSMLEALVNGVGFGLGQAILGVTSVITLGANGVREAVVRKQLRDWLEEELESRYREEALEEMKDKLNLASSEFGTTWKVIPMRMTISSRSRAYDLAAMHRDSNNPINLYEIAGYAPIGCKDSPVGRSKYKLVYKDTDYRVDYADIRDYLAGEEVAEFVLISGEKQVLKDMLVVAERNYRQMGIYLEWEQFETIEAQQDEFFQSSTKVDLLADRITNEFGLNDVCDLPAVMVFDYEGGFFGFAAAWWLGTARQATAATVRSNFLAHLFGTLLAHEMGHCFGLCHSGHDGAEHIMYTSAANGNNCGNITPGQQTSGGPLKAVTVATFFEYVTMGGEPRFTLDDGKNAWIWILTQAAPCL